MACTTPTALLQKTITGGGENTCTGESVLSLQEADQEVTDGAGEKKDMEAGTKTATAVNKEVTDGVGEEEVMVASENSQQKPELEIATTVDKDVTKEKKDTDASDPFQTEQVGASMH